MLYIAKFYFLKKKNCKNSFLGNDFDAIGNFKSLRHVDSAQQLQQQILWTKKLFKEIGKTRSAGDLFRKNLGLAKNCRQTNILKLPR